MPSRIGTSDTNSEVGGRANPVEATFADAVRWRTDLIAVGTRGPSGLDHLILGSLAEALLERAGCPALTVGRATPHR